MFGVCLSDVVGMMMMMCDGEDDVGGDGDEGDGEGGMMCV